MRTQGQMMIRQEKAVEDLRRILAELQSVSDSVFRLPIMFIQAYQECLSASTCVKRALFTLDDSGDSEHILERRMGV